MKKRRIAIVAFLLVACMVIGIGYANLSKNLTISSLMQSEPDSENFHVFFLKEAEYITNVSNATATVGDTRIIANFNSANFLKAPGDVATATFTVKNETPDLAAKVYLPTLNVTVASGFYTPECAFVDAAGNELTESSAQPLVVEGESKYVLLQPNETVKVKVTCTLHRTPEAAVRGEFSYTINAKSTAVTP